MTFYVDETSADEMEAVAEQRRDADAEMAGWAAAGRAVDRARAEGRCPHLSAVGYLPEPVYEAQHGLKPGESRCTDGCGRVFASDEDWYAAMDGALYGEE